MTPAKAKHGEPVVLVGSSLGGFIAREYAREHPQDVRRVITLGRPVIGGPRYTATAGRYRAQGHDLDQFEQNVKHVEVSETQVGLGSSPAVMQIIAAAIQGT